ncbi:hypothetical protein UA70_22115 [Raoultella planticola]|nr:hypothetical protein UA70_22115 [Raoultella planticola]
MIFRPLQHLFDLRPVGNIIKFNQPQRGAGDDQAVKVLVANIVEVTVEVIQVFTWRIAGFTRIDAQKLDIKLQRRVRKQAQELILRLDFFGIRLRISTFSGRIS